jgi:hypothetical protein
VVYPHSIPVKSNFLSNITMEIRVWRFENYRDCKKNAIPINFKSPESDFLIKTL